MLSQATTKQNGNFLILVSFISVSLVLFLSVFSKTTSQSLAQITHSRLQQQSEQLSKNALERAEHLYKRHSTILDYNFPVCKKIHSTENGAEGIFYDFGELCLDNFVEGSSVNLSAISYIVIDQEAVPATETEPAIEEQNHRVFEITSTAIIQNEQNEQLHYEATHFKTIERY